MPDDAVIGVLPRLLAWQVLQAVERGAYADGALEQVFKRAAARSPRELSVADRALVTELAYGTLRQQGLLNGWIDQLGKVPAARQPPKLRWLLQLGAYQVLFCRGIPAAAAVNTSVALARQLGLGRLSGVVNGLLRELDRRHRAALEAGDPAALAAPWLGLDLPVEPAASLALRRSLPLWLCQELLGWLPQNEAEAVAAACNATPRLDLRINPLRADRAAVQQALAASGLEAMAIAGLVQGLELGHRSGALARLPGYSEGHWSVQDRSAQQVVPLLAPQPGEWILDACAAPGGKTTQIAELSGGEAVVWAIDRAEARLRRLQRNAERLGLKGIHLLAADATELPRLRPDWLGRFDAVLLDAPCSGLGTLARHSDARWRISAEDIDALVDLQQRLLAAMALLLRPGGRLVYATCTVHPRENGEQMAWFVGQHPGFRLKRSWQRWPGDGDGFYAALLQGAGGAATGGGGTAIAGAVVPPVAAGGVGPGAAAPGPLGGASVGVPSGTGA